MLFAAKVLAALVSLTVPLPRLVTVSAASAAGDFGGDGERRVAEADEVGVAGERERVGGGAPGVAAGAAGADAFERRCRWWRRR